MFSNVFYIHSRVYEVNIMSKCKFVLQIASPSITAAKEM
jgi:hypothetical protein